MCVEIKRYLDNNYREDISLDTLAEVAHINKYYLAHTFQKAYGISPITYLHLHLHAARRRTGDRTALLRAGAGTGAGGIRGRRAADRAGRLSAAGIAAPLLDEVWEYEAAEAAVAGRSHFISLHKRSGNVCSRVILCRKCLNRAEKQQNPDGRSRPGIGCKNRNKTQRLENCGARRAAFKPYCFLPYG